MQTQVVCRWLVAMAWALAAAPVLSKDNTRTERIQFDKGASSAVVEGRIKGYRSVDYLISARRGQAASISLATQHTATSFNILAPGQTEVAFFNGSTGQGSFEGVLPADGTYRVRVYMMRSAARRNETANYRLKVTIRGAAPAAQAPSNDAKVPGTDFHATGKLPCAMGGGQPTGSCAFGVKRKGQGSGTVELVKPDGASE
jgi:hypothetical protein